MKEAEKLRKTIPVRITEDLLTELNETAQKLDMPKQEAIRLCLRIGLTQLKRVKYDLASCVLEKK